MSSGATFLVKNMRAVGMHHHGPAQLIVNANYCLRWEPECLQDLGNAIALYDCKGKTRAYLTRKDAAVISDLFFAGIVCGTMVGKTCVLAHCVEQKLGPQQECTLQFKVAMKDVLFVEMLFKENNFVFIKR